LGALDIHPHTGTDGTIVRYRSTCRDTVLPVKWTALVAGRGSGAMTRSAVGEAMAGVPRRLSRWGSGGSPGQAVGSAARGHAVPRFDGRGSAPRATVGAAKSVPGHA